MEFIDEIVESLLADSSVPMEQVMVILPNKRAKRFLLKSLMSRIEKPLFSPKIISINEFIEELSPFQLVDKQELLLYFYGIYCEMFGEEEEISQFLGTAPLFLTDINDVDIQMINPDDIFKNLSEIKEMETSFCNEKLTRNQQKYLKFYEKLKDLYLRLREVLAQNNLAYQGMMYRDVAEQVADYAQKLSCERFLFAGFHALSPSETKIVDYFYKNCNCQLLFDIDEFYEEKYASFTKKIQKQLGIESIEVKNEFKTLPKNVSIVGISGKVSQVYYAIDLLNKIEEEQKSLDDTVLVFADESMLLPFVHAYGTRKANFTMGYPIKSSPAYELLALMLELCRNAYRFKSFQSSDRLVYYRKDLLAILRNPLISNYIQGAADVERRYSAYSTPFVSNDKIFPTEVFFPNCENLERFLPELIRFFQELSGKIQDENPNKIILAKLIEQLQSSEELLQRFVKKLKLSTWDRLLSMIEVIVNDRVASVTLPFAGDFDKGLQVMGLLETRILDFKNVIVLSVNEGILPKGKSNSSLFMYDLKRFFKMPTHQEKDAIFAYHFFRLMQRASQIHILYDTETSESLQEKSRFIKQLEFELEEQSVPKDVVAVEHKSINVLPTLRSESFSIRKTDDMLKALRESSFSPSSLSKYIHCPMQFYFHYVAKIRPVDKDAEDIEDSEVGSVVHKVFEDLFRKAVDSGDNPADLMRSALSNVEEKVDEVIADNEGLRGMDFSRGKPFLVRSVIMRYVKNYLEKALVEYEKENYQIIGVEETFKWELQDGDGGKYKLSGKADRVDNRNGVIHILDYKTGRVDKLSADLDLIFTDPSYHQLFQLCFYTYLYIKKEHNQKVTSGIVSLQAANRKGNEPMLLKGTIAGNEYGLPVEAYQEKLLALLNDIFSKENEFKQTPDVNRCSNCDYREICKRYEDKS